MGHVHPPTRHRDNHSRDMPHDRDLDHKNSELGALREENSELRLLLIELSRRVIRNVVEKNH